MTQNFENLSLAASVASNTLTVSLKTNAGTDPSPSNQVNIAFRNVTLTDSTYVVRCISSSLSITLSSGSLGFNNNELGRIYVWSIDNNGTVELALARKGHYSEEDLMSTTAIGGGANDPDTMYSATARTNISARLLGYMEIQTGSTAGNWSNTPNLIQIMGPGVRRTGEQVQEWITLLRTQVSGTTTFPSSSANTVPQNTEGNQYLSLSITPTSVTNQLFIDSVLTIAGGNINVGMALFQDSTTNALGMTWITVDGSGQAKQILLTHQMVAGSKSTTTFKIRAGMDVTGTFYVNGNGLQRGGGKYNSHLRVREVVA